MGKQLMAVTTRIDARSARNSAIQIQDANGNILATVEVVASGKSAGIEKMRNEANLRMHTADGVRIVKATGVVLRKK